MLATDFFLSACGVFLDLASPSFDFGLDPDLVRDRDLDRTLGDLIEVRELLGRGVVVFSDLLYGRDQKRFKKAKNVFFYCRNSRAHKAYPIEVIMPTNTTVCSGVSPGSTPPPGST